MYVAQADLEFAILLPSLPKCWDYNVHYHAQLYFLNKVRFREWEKEAFTSSAGDFTVRSMNCEL
jgi:hypothetical protein